VTLALGYYPVMEELTPSGINVVIINISVFSVQVVFDGKAQRLAECCEDFCIFFARGLQ
jgi:hypothetical protein